MNITQRIEQTKTDLYEAALRGDRSAYELLCVRLSALQYWINA